MIDSFKASPVHFPNAGPVLGEEETICNELVIFAFDIESLALSSRLLFIVY